MPKSAINFLHSRTTQEGILLRESDWRMMAGIILFLGIVLRIIPYLHNRSLWLDETWLALNILQKSFAQLAGPLDYQQMAPLGFLFIEKFLVLTFGESEYALRAFPLLAGILSLFLFYGVARRMLTPRGLTVALGLFAISEPLLRYSSELKQYSSDVAIALSVSWLGLICLEKETRFVPFLSLFSIIGAILVWFSHPAIFSLAGVGVALTLHGLKTKRWEHVVWLFVPASFWLGSFALNYFTHLEWSLNPKMAPAYSAGAAFLPIVPISINDLMAYSKAFLNMFLYPGGLPFYGLAAFCFIIGWVSRFHEKRYACYVLTLPILVTFIASGLQQYPLKGRLILFLVPALMVFIGGGVDRLMTEARPAGRVTGMSLCVLLFLFPVYTAMAISMNPGRMDHEDARPVMNYLSQHYQEGDTVYLYYSSEGAFEYYGKRVGLEGVPYRLGVPGKRNWNNYVIDLKKLQGNDRVWILFSHVHKNYGIDEEKFFLYVLDEMGNQIDSFKRTGASLYLYDLRSNSTQQ